jgi:hypothetical protein
MRYKNGDTFTGKFVNGEKDGRGTLKKSQREYTYVGEFYQDEYCGLGELKEDNITYRGEFD